MKGIEPSNAGATIRSVNHFATSAIFIKTGVAGIEPTPTVLETVVLPLNYTPNKMEESGFEPLNPKERIYSPSRLATSLLLHDLKWRETESNCRHTELQSVALPTELPRQTVPTGFEPAIFCVTGRHVNPYTTEPYTMEVNGIEPLTLCL